MATLYTINLKNNSAADMDFFFFQKPAQYVGGPVVYSNSIYSSTVQPYKDSGAVLTFQFLQQYYAGAQSQKSPLVVGQASGFTTASQAIDLSNAATKNADTTEMSVDPSLGLTPPVNTPGVQPGAFRIQTPKFNPTLHRYNAGLAVKNKTTGQVVLSNFVEALPQQNIDCQPVLTFYVQTGSYKPGNVINFSQSSRGSAACDTTPGFTNFDVTYNVDGSWSVVPSAGGVLRFPGLSQLIGDTSEDSPSEPILNTEIRNEANRAVISMGHADSYAPPFTVSDLTNPGAIQVHGEYPVAAVGAEASGHMCIAKGDDSATFGR